MSIVEFMSKTSPDLIKPTHLESLTKLLELSCEPGGFRQVVAIPPQHGATITLVNSLLWIAIEYPKRKHLYITYSAERAEYIAFQFKELAKSIGLSTNDSTHTVKFESGSCVKFLSVGGSICGYCADGLILIDNPYKGRAEAESASIREKTSDWFNCVVMTKRGPKTSIVCVSPRWNKDDLSGELLSKGYPYMNFKAIAQGPVDDNGNVYGDPCGRKSGEALFPWMKGAEFFEEERKDKVTWRSLYQGEPQR